MNYLFPLIFLTGAMVLVQHFPLALIRNGTTPKTLGLGFMLLSAFIFSRLFLKIRLPRVSGYLIAGLFFGPSVAGLFSKNTLEGVQFINHLALAFIAFSAGGELRLTKLKERAKSLALIIGFSLTMVFSGLLVTIVLLGAKLPFLAGLSLGQVLAVGSIIGIIGAARSPSSAIAIIDETRAAGRLTDTVLSASIAIDVIIIILFAFIISFCETLFNPTAHFDALYLLIIIGETFAAILAGLMLGGVISLLIKLVHADLPIIIVLLGVLVNRSTDYLGDLLVKEYGIGIHLEPLLICMATGFSVANFSKYSEHFLAAMKKVALPIYALFFALAGAAIDLEILKQAWLIGLLIFGVRGLMLWIGISTGAFFGGEPKKVRRYAWLGFITQAGVGLGLANEVAARYPEWGIPVATLLIAVISMNQIAGPMLFKLALSRAGEIRKVRNFS